MNLWTMIASFGLLVLLAFAILFASLKTFTNKWRYVPAIVLLLLLPMLAYLSMGQWAELQSYTLEQSRLEKAKAMLAQIRSPQQLVDKLKAQLQKNPNSARGWYLLGRIYSSQQEWTRAEESFTKAYQLDKQDEAILIHYAGSLWQNNQQKCTDTIRQLYQEVLKNNPNQPDALSMLAMDAYQNHKYLVAIAYWEKLLKLVPARSEEARAIQKAIYKAQKALP